MEKKPAGDAVHAVIGGVVWTLDALLLVRLLGFLFGAEPSGLLLAAYRATGYVTRPLRPLFIEPATGTSAFDVAAAAAMLLVPLAGWLLTLLADLARRPQAPKFEG